jgi:hypothetical protein
MENNIREREWKQAGADFSIENKKWAFSSLSYLPDYIV